METLSDVEARARREAHEQRVDALVAAHLDRRSRGEKHPVEDFLFTYYSYRPSALRRWHPGIGSVVTGGEAKLFAGRPGYTVTAGAACVDPACVDARRDRVEGVRDLLRATAGRPPAFGCFGLHEWAMVYRQPAEEVRHSSYALRLGASGTNQVVESHRLACTHVDAFRFFTDDARPLNALEPTRARQAELDQPGCLHASMDLYKWAYTLVPLTSSELVVDCFELALDIRWVDMAASPYDLTSLGVTPIRIETPTGKQQYLDAQRTFAARAAPLRDRLLDVCTHAPQTTHG